MTGVLRPGEMLLRRHVPRARCGGGGLWHGGAKQGVWVFLGDRDRLCG